MPALLIGGLVLSILLALMMTVVASKLLRESRARSAARVAALQALVDDTPLNTSPALMTSAQDSSPDFLEEPWDLDPQESDLDELPPAAHVEVRTLPRERRGPAAEVRTSNFELRSSAIDHALFEEPAQRTPSRRWTWMAATGLLMASVAGVVFALSSGVVGRAVAASNPRTVAASASPMELLSLRYSIDPSGTFTVTGLVQNPAASASLRGVFAVVYLFDAEGRYFASGRAALESAVLSPGGEAGFTVHVQTSSRPALSSRPSTIEVSRYRVSFQQEDGVAVNHVDRRGALPDQTTGDTVQSPARSTSAVTARKD